MSDARVGKTLSGPEPRDAIHVPVASFQTGTALSPGTKVIVKDQKVWAAADNETPIGVVDPFIGESAPADTWVWVLFYPGSVRTVRHAWTHPAVGKDDSLALKVERLKEIQKEYEEAEDKFCCVEQEDMDSFIEKFRSI